MCHCCRRGGDINWLIDSRGHYGNSMFKENGLSYLRSVIGNGISWWW